MKVALVGLGNMGTAIAQRILCAGHDLTVWNRTASKAQAVVEQGAKASGTARECVSGAEVVVTSLIDDKSVLDAVRSADGILAGMDAGAVHLCVMTISPNCAEELAALHEARGTHYVSGPVVGRPDAAAGGQLASFLAGPADAIKTVTPVCEAYSSRIVALSQRPSVANCMKLAINYNVASTIELIGETYVFAEKSGIPLELVRDFYRQMWFAHPAAKMYAEKLRQRDFAGRGGFTMTGGLKDLRLMLSAAADVGAPLEIGAIVARKLSEGVDRGMAETDWSALYEISRREAGLS